jgi:hypothetical protein
MSNIKTILPERFPEEDHPSNPHHSTHVVIHTDGSCIGNPGPGGWAAILQWGSHRREISGRFRETTNNRMELWGRSQHWKFLPSLATLTFTPIVPMFGTELPDGLKGGRKMVGELRINNRLKTETYGNDYYVP